MLRKGKIVVCAVLAILLSMSATVVFASGAVEAEEALIVSETTTGRVHKKEITNIQRYQKSRRKNKNSQKYISEVLAEYNIDEESLGDAEQIIIQDEVVGIAPMYFVPPDWGYGLDEDGNPIGGPGSGTGGGSGSGSGETATTETDNWTDSEWYIKITTVCIKMAKLAPDGNPIWKIEGTAYFLKSFKYSNKDIFHIVYTENAYMQNDMQKLSFYENKSGVKTNSVLQELTFRDLHTEFQYSSSLSFVRITIYIKLEGTTMVKCNYFHNESNFPIETRITAGFASFTFKDNKGTQYAPTSITLSR